MGPFSHNPRCITPSMTSASTPSPFVASASTEWDSAWTAWGAFTHSATDRSWSPLSAPPQWLMIDLGAGGARRVDGYTVTGRHDPYPQYNASAWHLQGSNDAGSWTTLDSQSGVYYPTPTTMHSITLARPSIPFRYFRLLIPAESPYGCIGELQLLGAMPRHYLPFRGRSRMR